MYTSDQRFYVAHSDNGPQFILGKMANRHGLIAGATGTGKTVSLQVLAESFSQAGVPCFMADMKGDLSGISQTGSLSSFIEKRCGKFGIDTSSLRFEGCPVQFLDVYGEQGHPVRSTVKGMGPVLLSRLLELNDVQSGVLTLVFKIAEDENLEVIDMKDLRLLLDYVSKNAQNYTTTYGNVSAQSIGAILRSLLRLQEEGADRFFGEPSFDIYDLLRTQNGKGMMSVLAADKLMLHPRMYSTFLMWLLTEIYNKLPEVGDMELPKLVFFFDEAHMLFSDAPKAMLEKIEQIVRLIRSKGVGVYFVTQSPSDIPNSVLGQLGNRVQHALRAFTPKDQIAVKAAAQTFRPNPAFSTEAAIMELETGEALVSFLDEKGSPSVVERSKMLFPLSQIGAITEDQRQRIISSSMIAGKYDKAIDRISAFEKIQDIRKEEAEKAERAKREEEKQKLQAKREKEEAAAAKKRSATAKRVGKTVFGSLIGTLLGTFARTFAREAVKGITGRSTTTRKSTKRR